MTTEALNKKIAAIQRKIAKIVGQINELASEAKIMEEDKNCSYSNNDQYFHKSFLLDQSKGVLKFNIYDYFALTDKSGMITTLLNVSPKECLAIYSDSLGLNLQIN